MRLINIVERTLRNLLPSPFTIALLLTLFTFLLAFFFTDSETTGFNRLIEIATYWEEGIWNSALLVFAMQMMLMLVLGHVLALSNPVRQLISNLTQYCTDTPKAALIVTLSTVMVALFNWGLGLVFGAILARSVAEEAARKGRSLNYGLIGAAGYSGLMVWHGGISGSAPIKAAESGHLKTLVGETTQQLPDVIPLDTTVLSSMNLFACLLVIIILPLFMYFLAKRTPESKDFAKQLSKQESMQFDDALVGMARLDANGLFSKIISLLILSYVVSLTIKGVYSAGFGLITPNYINLLLLGLGLFMHRSIQHFLHAVDDAIGGASGILLQFPLYFGIMGIMIQSGLVQQIADFFISISTPFTYPIYTFYSAGIINIFIPSGGGQWGVQGPIVIRAATELGVPYYKAIMALAYGDQLTNMLQPFWALPLLGITGLKAKQILPYSVALMMVGIVIYTLVLIMF